MGGTGPASLCQQLRPAPPPETPDAEHPPEPTTEPLKECETKRGLGLGVGQSLPRMRPRPTHLQWLRPGCTDGWGRVKQGREFQGSDLGTAGCPAPGHTTHGLSLGTCQACLAAGSLPSAQILAHMHRRAAVRWMPVSMETISPISISCCCLRFSWGGRWNI